jgi:hypothetical protein
MQSSPKKKEEKKDNYKSPWPKKCQTRPAFFSTVSPPVTNHRKK